MVTHPTVIRRYTPPTCTLKIMAQQSPLSRWLGKLALKDLRFKLSFDDPRLDHHQWMTLQGNQEQLESLAEAVDQYVQQFLDQSIALVRPVSSAPAESASPAVLTAPAITLQSGGLLSHQLQLGSLATAETGEYLNLSATQLADLTAALDEYRAEATTLPRLARPGWAGLSQHRVGIAAGVLVLVGLSASILRHLDRSTPPAASNLTASSSDQRLALEPPASPSPPSGPLPLASLSPITSPPLAPAGTPVPLPSSAVKTTQVPTIANVPIAQTAPPQAPAIVSIPNPPAPSKETASELNSDMSQGVAVAPIPGSRASSSARSSTANSNSPTAPKGAIFDTPTSAAIRAYFQQRWQSQDGLSQSLQYRLEINPDGSLLRATPLGELAGTYLDRTGMPLAGEKIAPTSEKPVIIRLLLEPDGNVQSFPE